MSTNQIVDELVRRLSETLRVPNQRVDPLMSYVNYGGDHPTQQCPIVSPQQIPRQNWCAIEQKWTNHTIEECSENRGQQVRKSPYHPDHQ